MKEHTNRIWWKTNGDGYSKYKVISEATVGGYNSALIEKYIADSNITRFDLWIDLSKYRKCWERVFYKGNEYDRSRILGFEVYLNDLQKKTKFYMRNVSPSTWDSGFGIAYYVESAIYEKPRNKMDSMKDAIRIGINEENIGQYVESMTKDAVWGMEPMIKCFEDCGEIILTPENEFYF
jgi:hypothetical protein